MFLAWVYSLYIPIYTAMASLEKLIDLAKRTGDRLIIHDPYSAQDVVIMGVDQYLALVEQTPAPIQQLSGKELVQKVNNDIALWHADKEMAQKEVVWELLAHELEQYRSVPQDGGVRAPNNTVEAKPVSQEAEVVHMDSLESEQEGTSDDIIYEIPVEEAKKPAVVSEIEWESAPSPRLRMQEGLANYTGRMPQAIPQKSEDLATFSENVPMGQQEGTAPVFFEEPI